MKDKNDFGLLITPDAKLQRKYFKEMVKLRGTNVLYQYPLSNKDYTTQGELSTGYSEPIKVGCIFEEYINQQTSKKLGWVSELQDKASIVHLPYDLENLQVGCLVKVPSAFDGAEGRLFRVSKMSATPIYPSSIACELVQEYTNNMEKAETELFVNSDFNLLNDEDE